MVTRADVVAASRRIAGLVHRTPVLTSRSLDAALGAELSFKCECLQRSGAFKMRGASNAVRLVSSLCCVSRQYGLHGDAGTVEIVES